ncbi:MAG: NAD(P)/FAD-dependent oxidoreductase [Clostridia bacterium]|nr:NAD(P)/FAD-dependent oxidoreductase [Clostridia bacterium]
MANAKILVVGGGAAGIMSALYAAKAGARVTLFEKNEKLGKKIYITGKGRCNVTNAAEPDEFMKNIVRNPRFLYASFACLDNVGLMELIENAGVKLKTERGERVFPESDHASDITNALEREIKRLGVSIRLNTPVKRILTEDNQAIGLETEDGEAVYADRVIIATGGVSYASTGSTGDGHRFAKELGHSIYPCRPALTPLETEESWPKDLMGLTLKNVSLSAFAEKNGKMKKLYKEQGEMLFTHFGVSGPLVLSLSSLLPDSAKGIKLFIDLKPALDEAQLETRILRDFSQMQRKQLFSCMDGLAPHALGMKILELADISPYTPIHSVTAQERKAIVKLLKNLPLTIKGFRGLNEAIITRGGVEVKSINPSTLESKLVTGLYFAGEVIDVDALTGGFNLQIAFSTGALAGKSAAEN